MMHARMRAGGERPAPPATTVCVRPFPQPATRLPAPLTSCSPTQSARPHNQLREKENRLSELVDGVVEGYHSGFARSIQNYSLILQVRGGPPPRPRCP